MELSCNLSSKEIRKAITTGRQDGVRQTVCALHLRRDNKPGIGFQKTTRSVEAEDLNWSVLQGEINMGEFPQQALIREAREEYGIKRICHEKMHYLFLTKLPVRPDSSKAEKYAYEQLHWLTLVTGTEIWPTTTGGVSHFKWCESAWGLEEFFSTMRDEKATVLRFALAAAYQKMPQLLSGFENSFKTQLEELTKKLVA